MKEKGELLRTVMRRGLSTIKKITVTEWAEKYRVLPSTAAEPGKYKLSRTPYAKEIMDAFTEEGITRVVVKSAAQVSKTTILENVLGRFANVDPCNMMIVMPTLEMAQDFSKDRLQKLIEDTKILTPLFYRDRMTARSRDKTQTMLSKFFTGGRLVLVGANSTTGLSSRPIRILLCDEVDRFPHSAGKEGDPVGLAAKRTSTYWNKKIGLFSTPTTEGASRIDVEYMAGTREEWSHQCPNCGEFHALDYRQMNVDFDEYKDDAGHKTVVVKKVLWRCPDCGMEFDELTIKNAPQKYIAKNPEARVNGIRSFWLNGFSSPWVSWAEIMQEWYEARGDAEAEQVVYNTCFGQSYRLKGDYSDENEFLQRREEYDAEIPSAVKILTAAVDVQDNRLEYEICGWSYGEEGYGIQKAQIWGKPNQLETWLELDKILDREYKRRDNSALKITRTFIDSGYSTENVYAYCRQRMHLGRFAIKGYGAQGIPLIHKFTKSGGVVVVILGVNMGKQEVFNRLGVMKPGKLYFHFPLDDERLGGRGYDQVYFKQLIAEHRVVKWSGGQVRQAWEPIYHGVRNEALDLRCYNICALKSLRIDWENFPDENFARPAEQPKKSHKPPKPRTFLSL